MVRHHRRHCAHAPTFSENFGTAVAVSGDASSAFVGDPNGSSANPEPIGTVTAYTVERVVVEPRHGAAVPPQNASSFGTSVVDVIGGHDGARRRCDRRR